MNDDITPAVQKAEQVRADNLVIQPPVRITEIAKNYGLQIRVADLGDFSSSVAGFIDPESRTIFVNADDPPTRQAFTIAHELGHWLMHKDRLRSDPDTYAILYRRPLGVNGDPVEKQANAFAAHLLVPKDMLEQYKDDNINTIADIFGVSVEVIGYRLKHEFPEK